jgi:Rieske Fe-S protein
MACQNCLNRRDFLTKSALAAVALAGLDACGDGQIGAPTRTNPGGGDPNVPIQDSKAIPLANFPALATVGTIVAVGGERAVIRTGTNTFRALSMICTHEQCDTDILGNRFECPCHGSIFAADGTVIRGPNGTGPQSITPLRVLSVTFDQAAQTITIA